MVPVLALRWWRGQLTQPCALFQGDRGESGPLGPYGPKGEGFPGPSVRHRDLGPSVCLSVVRVVEIWSSASFPLFTVPSASNQS